jgi:hypothetical protein
MIQRLIAFLRFLSFVCVNSALRSRRNVCWLFALLLLGPTISESFNEPDRYTSGNSAHTAALLDPPARARIAKALTMALMAGSAALVQFVAFFDGTERHARRSPWAVAVLASVLAFWLVLLAGDIVCSAPMLTYGRYAASLLIILFPLRHAASYEDLWRIYRWYIISVCVLCLLVAASVPGVALELGYKGVIPGINLRLHGFFCHANNLAELIGLYLLLPKPPSGAVMALIGPGRDPRKAEPAERRQRKASALQTAAALLADLLCVAVLVATQCKTAIVLVVVGFAMRALVAATNHLSTFARMMVIGLAVSCAVGGILSAGAIMAQLRGVGDLSGQDVETLSNRTLIWEMVIADWQTSPIFGFGPSKWADEMTTFEVDGFIPGHAHSQTFQTLWEVGIVGLFVLIVHALTTISAAASAPAALRGGLVAAVLFFCLRGYTEVVVALTALANINYSLHVALLALLCAALKEAAQTAASTTHLALGNQVFRPRRPYQSPGPVGSLKGLPLFSGGDP